MANKKLSAQQQIEKEINDIEIEIHANDVRFQPDKKLTETLNKKRLALLKKAGRKP